VAISIFSEGKEPRYRNRPDKPSPAGGTSGYRSATTVPNSCCMAFQRLYSGLCISILPMTAGQFETVQGQQRPKEEEIAMIIVMPVSRRLFCRDRC